MRSNFGKDSSSNTASWNWNIVGLLEKGNRSVTRDEYLFAIACVASLCGVIHGYLVTLLGFIVDSDSATSSTVSTLDDIDAYSTSSSPAGVLQSLANSISNLFGAIISSDGSDIETDISMYTSSTTSSSSPLLYSYYTGLILGALLSYALSDICGRKIILVTSSFCSVLFVVWCAFSLTTNDLYSAVLFVGWTVGILLSIAPCYVSEVCSVYVHSDLGCAELPVCMLCGFRYRNRVNEENWWECLR
jgi:MFS family permease